MKRNPIARIILYSIIALVLTGILVTALVANGFGYFVSGNDGIAVNYEASVESESCIKLEINWADGSVSVKRENVDRIIFREVAEDKIKRPMTYSYVGGTLELNHSNASFSFGISNPQEKHLVVVVPMDWYCDELVINGAALTIDIIDLTVGALTLDGAGLHLSFSGNVGSVDIDGAGCETKLVCTSKPDAIEVDSAGCKLELTLPEGCGFLMEMDGLGCKLNTDVSFQRKDGAYIYGSQHCQIDVDGVGCEVTITEAVTGSNAYTVNCANDFTALMLVEPLATQYAPGTIVKLKTDILTDVDLELYVDGQFICKQTEAFHSDGSNYWEFYFTMPDHNTTIELKTSGGLLPD